MSEMTLLSLPLLPPKQQTKATLTLPQLDLSVFTEDQQGAIKFGRDIFEQNLLGTISGAAGTGKTFALRGHLLDMMHNTTAVVCMCAPTHQAVGVLREKLGFAYYRLITSTLASALSLKESTMADGTKIFVPSNKNYANLKGVNHLVIDESSMIGDKEFQYVLEAQDIHGFSVLFVGDMFQIPPVKNGGRSWAMDAERFYRDYELRLPYFSLTKIIRQGAGNPIIELATILRELQEGGERRIRLEEHIVESELMEDTDTTKGLLLVEDADELIDMLNALYLHESYNNTPSFVRTVSYKNDTMRAFNSMVRVIIHGEEFCEENDFAEGEVIVLREPYIIGKEIIANNNQEVRITSCELEDVFVIVGNEEVSIEAYRAEVETLEEGGSFQAYIPTFEGRAYLEQELSNWGKNINKMPPASRGPHWRNFYAVKGQFLWCRHAHAQTVHTSQGSTFNYTIMLWDEIASVNNSNECLPLLYTALTRASDAVIIYRGVNFWEHFNTNKNG